MSYAFNLSRFDLNDENSYSRNRSLLDKLGGDQALKAAIGCFYSKVLEIKELKVFFGGTNMEHLKMHQY